MKAHGGQGLGRLRAKLGMNAALNDAEQGAARLAMFLESRERSLGPAKRKLHRPIRLIPRRRIRRAFVELHLDVGSQKILHLDGALGRQFMRRAINMRAESHATFGNGPKLAQRHDLIAAGIGQDRAVPAHEAMEAAESRDPLGSRAQHEVIGVAENDICARGFDVVDEHGFDRRGGADRHEGGGVDDAARSCDFSKARVAVVRLELEREEGGQSEDPPARLSRHASP